MSLDDRFSDPSMIENPYDYYDALRAEGPIYYSNILQAYFVTRHQDAQYILMNPQMFSSSPGASGQMFTNFMEVYRSIYQDAGTHPPLQTLVTTDGATHKRYRKAVDGSFNAGSVRKLEGKVLGLIDELIDDFIDRGSVDIYEAFCLKLPLYVICEMVGLPKEDALLMKSAADAAARLAVAALESEESRIALHKELASFHVYLQRHIDYYRDHPADNLLSQLIHTTPEDGVPLNDQELISVLTVINVGGNETTTNGLGNMFALCFERPELQRYLREKPEEIPNFVEEALRLESPVSALPRWVVEDTEINGTKVPAGACLQMSYAAMNRDGSQYGCPAKLDLSRPNIRRHMAFGIGPHFCLGSILARMELQVAMRRMLERLDDIQVENQGQPLVHDFKLVVRSLKKLPVRFAKRP